MRTARTGSPSNGATSDTRSSGGTRSRLATAAVRTAGSGSRVPSTLTGRLEPGYALVAAAVAGVAFALTRLLWRTALKRYSGASG